MSTTDSMSDEDKAFLASCEKEFKDRYTERDEEFMKVYNAEPSKPPIIESWWVPQNSGHRNDRRNNKRIYPYENKRDHGGHRGYNDYNNDNNREQGYRDKRSRYY